MSEPLLVATTNPGKYREIGRLLSDLPIQVRSLDDYPDLPEVDEDARTFMGNAEKKALHYAELTGLTTLADDSGLEVDCLEGRPGVRSARFAGSTQNDQANNERLLALLEGTMLEERTARFRCAIAVVRDGRIVARAEGTLEGLITDQPRGSNGFGYDPYFLIPGLNRTSAELDPDHKNRISHRARALTEVRKRLERLGFPG